ncbi:MAG: class I SAM-dependent methyltransferase [Pseudomonadota bacterium]
MLDRSTLSFYQRHAEAYGAVKPTGAFAQYCDWFRANVPSKSRVLDIGCGGGHASEQFLRAGLVVIAIDASPDLATVTENRINQSVIVGDFMVMSLPGQFSGVWAAASLTHCAGDAIPAAIGRVSSYLEPAGLFVASFKANDNDWRDDSGRLYGCCTKTSLMKAANDAGLSVERLDVRDGVGRDQRPTEWIWLVARKKTDL